MSEIWKYKINTEERGQFTIEMPEGSKIIFLKNQLGTPTIWAIVDSEKPETSRIFKIYCTGEPIKEMDIYLKFIGTFFYEHETLGLGTLVFHLFEILEEVQ